MKGFLSIFKESAKEFGKLRTLTVTAVLIALYVILEGLFSINIGPYIRINFAFLSIAVIGMLYGPTVAMTAAAICDILGFIVKPQGGYLIALTFITALSGLIYGLCLYRRSGKSLVRASLGARLLDTVVCNLTLNTLALMHYGFIPATIVDKAMLTRLIKNALEYPVYAVLLIGLLSAVQTIYRKTFRAHKT